MIWNQAEEFDFRIIATPQLLEEAIKAQLDLGFTARVSLAEGLRELVAWWQAERALDQTEAKLLGIAP